MQRGHDALARDRLLGAAVVDEGFARKLRLAAFAYKGEAQELQCFAVHIELGARRAQRQGDADAIFADHKHFAVFLGACSFALAGARVADGLVRLVKHLEGQAIDQFLELGIVLEAGQDAADRELTAQVFQGGVVCGFGVFQLLELAHQLIGFVIVEGIVGLADGNAQFADLVAFLGSVKRVQHHLADDLGGWHML